MGFVAKSKVLKEEFCTLHRATSLALLPDVDDAECDALARLAFARAAREHGKPFLQPKHQHLATLRSLGTFSSFFKADRAGEAASMMALASASPSAVLCLDLEGFRRSTFKLVGLWASSPSLEFIFVLRTLRDAVVMPNNNEQPSFSSALSMLSSSSPWLLISEDYIHARNKALCYQENDDDDNYNNNNDSESQHSGGGPSAAVSPLLSDFTALFLSPTSVGAASAFRDQAMVLQQRPASPEYSDPAMKRLYLISREMRLDDGESMPVHIKLFSSAHSIHHYSLDSCYL